MRYHLMAIATMCCWGTTFVSSKVLLNQGLSPADIFLLRFALAYAGMALLHHERLWCSSLKDEALMLLAGVSGGSMYFYAENTALRFTQAGNVSLVVCLAPLLTALIAVFRRKAAPPSPRLWAGSAVALAGVAFVVRGSSEGAPDGHVAGCLLALAAAALWAVYQTIAKPLGDRYGAALLTRKVFGYGLLTISGLCLMDSSLSRSVLEQPVVWGNVLFLGAVASFLCYFTWNRVVERLGPVVSANYIYLNPLVTALFSFAFLGERLTPGMLAGGAGILVGVYLSVTSSRPHHGL